MYEVRRQEISRFAGLLQLDYQAQASALFSKAKEQEADFKQLLEGLAQPSSQLEASNVLKSVGSIEEKLGYYGGDSTRVDDLLRGAIVTDIESIGTESKNILKNLRSNLFIQDINPRFI